MTRRLIWAGFGILATLVGMAAGHLVAAFTDPAASPVLTVGSTVIDLTPTPMKEWAIRTFGDDDKAVLVGSVMLGALVLAAVAGLLARRRFLLGAGVLVLLVASAAVMSLLRPGAAALDVLPAVVAGIVGVAALWLLARLARENGVRPTTAADDATAPSRRGVLLAAGALGVAAAVLAGAGQWVTGRRTTPAGVSLPQPADPAPGLPTDLRGTVPGISRLQTPTSSFYRVDTRLTLPIVDLDDWTLTIDGDVENELTFTYADLLAMPMIERDITLTCVSNDVGGPYVGAARWLGVRLSDLLDQAGVGGGADQIFSTDVDGMTLSTPLEMALAQEDAMVAVGMNGEALPEEHGFPARMVIPGLYGFISATKWISRMTLTTYAEKTAYWTDRKWATDAPIKTASRIDTPQSFSTIDAGDTFIGGVAWAQTRGIGKVEVQVDGGAWQEAELGPDVGVDYWRQWYFPWTAEAGEHDLSVRATDLDGAVQTDAKAAPFPNGSSGRQRIIVTVG
ncbi:molybdopterin-dependent oxidoreductase [Nocardioides sp.]|uniref:molybdopterin-dependent oxidoreductase n=1 Tax=Nocardioides sp. TaxID=35761 RepID=UPI002D7FA363|nr:molybdopterin-dependent oxidoreductase [Nocardioides sp.]HET8959772.1 molybdopterin-dependent oxidoreductase [Nocardioides sp.]